MYESTFFLVLNIILYNKTVITALRGENYLFIAILDPK